MSFALKEICGPGFVFVTYFANSFDHSLGCHGNRHKQNPYFNCANNTSRTSCHTHSSHQSFSCSSRSWWVEKLYCLLLFNCKIYTLPLTPLEVSGFVSRRILPFPIRWCRGKYHTTDSGGGGGSRGGELGLICWVCATPIRTPPTPLQCILWPVIDPISVTFGQM